MSETKDVALDQLELNLNLKVAEANVILASLKKHPFEEVATLIGKIKAQGDAQVAAAAQPDAQEVTEAAVDTRTLLQEDSE